MAASMARILFLVSLAAALAMAAAGPAAAAAAAAAARGHGRLIHLHFFMHDITGGPGQTAVQIVKGAGPAHPAMPPGSHFGDTTVMDDALTEGAAASSRLVGRARGTYTLASLREPVLSVAVNLALTGGAYNGSTVAVAGLDDISVGVRELAVVGGTGAFRRATGHVLWRTARMESRDHMVVELDVYATVPAARSPPPPRADDVRPAALNLD
ncbi:hypothetical protein SEVIR_9G186700v4 [Setaria viridis]|uniref:Dirigent protein n=2 Tax=Setaria TaxID=4554 RepID=K4AF35_SETIT|nr:dirigent protein 1 [Setaria italica]XP_034576625.1 dirigent protein 1-like [Setaria viridis]RCV42090.1 hypothetical protein SETIT_9G187600v2 [Setaria italica]TKV92831.1 hypothetical protein SEVIR_9G186700v2 [Setaria viridis]